MKSWLALLALSLIATAAEGQEAAADGADALSIRTSFKSSVLLSRLPDDPALFPDQDTATGLWRLRLEPTVRWGDRVSADVAFEQRLRITSSAARAGGALILPPEAPAAFRIRQLDWQFAATDHGEWRGEIDRAAVHVGLSRAEVTIGRQAIGWGRGALFGAIDLFAPFTPLEADREWRRGVDAVRTDVRLGDRLSLDSVAAFDDRLADSAAATRLRGYAGKVDVEVLGGYRARDLFGGATSSAAIGDAELHGELAVFRTEAVPGSVGFGTERSVVKAVGGGSYRLPVGKGILVLGEYHYSGFGAPSPEQIVAYLADPAFQQRYLRGDTQILGRHAVAVLGSYEYAPEVALAGQWITSPIDGSGVVVASATWTISDALSVLFSGYVPYGSPPVGFVFQSEYGSSPAAVFVQLKIYR